MSPDIEWHIGEESERETITGPTDTPPSRRRWAVIMAIGLGVGLGLAYRSIPEPSPNPLVPTATPAIVELSLPPSPTPEALETALQRDAFHLAAFPEVQRTFDPSLGRMPQAYADWYAALQSSDLPGAGGRWESAITVFETGTLPSGVVWAALGQFRNEDFFRHTRFYRRQDGRWVWTLPDWSFWKGATAAVMSGDASPIGPITMGHPMEDATVIGGVFDRFTRAYLNLCQSLQCPRASGSIPAWEPGLALVIAVQPQATQPVVQERRGWLQISLPSPRVVGYYEDANTSGDPFVAMAYDMLIDPAVRLASGDYLRWETERGGELFLQAIARWKRARIQEVLKPTDLFFAPAVFPGAAQREEYTAWLRNESLLPVDALWDWPTRGRGFGLLQHLAVGEAEAVVAFVEDRYGEESVVRFLNALGRARSFEEAIEAALPIRYAEFIRQWRGWIAGE
jgi:hypothetical protein